MAVTVNVLHSHGSFSVISTSGYQIVQMAATSSSFDQLYKVSKLKPTIKSRENITNLDRGNMVTRKREKDESPVYQIVVSQMGCSGVEREMAPESYELLIPGLSDSWLPGL